MKLEMVHVDNELVGFLECAAERTKTSVSLERKVRFLPIAVPVQSLTSPPWLPVWDQLRNDQGLTSSGHTSNVYPIMPAPAAGGGWSQAALGVTPALVSGSGTSCAILRLSVTSGWRLIAARLRCSPGAPKPGSTMTQGDCWATTRLRQTNLCLSIQEMRWPNR